MQQGVTRGQLSVYLLWCTYHETKDIDMWKHGGVHMLHNDDADKAAFTQP